MRSHFESIEAQILSPLAVQSRSSLGRAYDEDLSSTRTCFQRDRDRIVHAKAFRRLKHKTQVFVATESDHYRSRLTHTLEVAQISRHLARLLRLNEDLAESIALAHDLGHTPFGHSGEKALNTMMAEHGGFEHNRQSLRIVETLERKYPHFPGLNLSFEVRQGLMKHQTPWDHPKGVESDGTFISLEAQVCNIADEIAYNNHDIDDGLTSGLLDEADLDAQVSLWHAAKKAVQAKHPSLGVHDLKYVINSFLISRQVEDVAQTTLTNLETGQIQTLDDVQKSTKPLVRFSPEMTKENQRLRKHLFTRFYSHHSVYRMNKKGQMIIEGLFQAFTTDRKLLPEDYQRQISTDYPLARVACDYIAGMTDVYASHVYQTIYA